MKEPLRHDITIKAGGDYNIDFSYQEDDGTPVDMTDWTAESQIREYPEAKDAFDFTISTDETGIHLSLNADETESIMFSRGVYDLFITDPNGSNRIPLVQGRARIIRDTTR